MHDNGSEAASQTGMLRVLIVDDNADEADSLASLLSLRHYAVERAYSADSALEVAAGFQPDVLLLDLGLPRMNGYELAGELRRTVPHAVLIAATGLVDEAYRLKAIEAGFEHYFVKPVSIAKLRQLLDSLASQRALPNPTSE